MTTAPPLPAYDVRLAGVAEVAGVCEVCSEGFAESSRGLLPPATIEQQAAAYYAPDNRMGIPFYLARGFAVRERVPYTTTDGRPTGAHSLRMSRPV